MAKKKIYTEHIDGFIVSLSSDGYLYVSFDNRKPSRYRWYQDTGSLRTWVPKKRNFIALMRKRIQNGEFDMLRSPDAISIT